MKTLLKVSLVAALAAAFATPALAYVIRGVIPPGRVPVVINLRKPIKPGLIQFKFSAPPTNAGVPYALDFCIGPAVNPCGRPDSKVVNVPKGQTRSASFNSAIFGANILVVGQGTRVPVPYAVQVN